MSSKKKYKSELDKHRDKALDPVIEQKLFESLSQSMLFFVFDQVCNFIADEEGREEKLGVHRAFFNEWKAFVNENIIKEDLAIVNKKLLSDHNIFYNVLSNKDETIESTEIYQEKYYKILADLEKNFFENFEDFNEN